MCRLIVTIQHSLAPAKSVAAGAYGCREALINKLLVATIKTQNVRATETDKKSTELAENFKKKQKKKKNLHTVTALAPN